jgi:hypothetical protein
LHGRHFPNCREYALPPPGRQGKAAAALRMSAFGGKVDVADPLADVC